MADVLTKKLVTLNLKATSKPDVIKELVEQVTDQYPTINGDSLVPVLLERE